MVSAQRRVQGIPLVAKGGMRQVVHRVRVGARFRGHNHHDALGTWETECEVVEVRRDGDIRRWVWNVLAGEGVGSTWAFEVEPTRDGVLIRQWGRMGPAPSGLSVAIEARPELEGRIVARRLSEWEQGMRANLDYVRATPRADRYGCRGRGHHFRRGDRGRLRGLARRVGIGGSGLVLRLACGRRCLVGRDLADEGLYRRPSPR